MKLVPKLTGLFIVGISVVLSVNGYLRVRREVRLFESDRVRSHELMARVLARGALAAWQNDGPESAIHMLDQLGERTGQLRIRWLSFAAPHLAEQERALKLLRPGAFRSLEDVPVGSERGRCIYTILETDDPAQGALSICETFEAQRAYVQKSMTETVFTTAALSVVCALLSWSLGAWFVGRPVAALSNKARQIGAGDLQSPLQIPSKDEFGALARDMNAMCEQLLGAARRVELEVANRIAAVEQLRHADRLTTVGELASGLAHELGTPLNVIEVRADMIARGETSPEESMDYARVIREASERMTRLIRKLLDFARPPQGERASHRVFELAAKTVEMLLPLATRKGIALRLREQLPLTEAVVDADQIEQVLTNLILNAIQALGEAGNVEVSVSLKRPGRRPGLPEAQGDFVCVAVRDDGPGIASEYVKRVFEPFFTTKEAGSGTGLGLAVSYGIVRDHGGSIEVESELGKGSAFLVYLPRGPLA